MGENGEQSCPRCFKTCKGQVFKDPGSQIKEHNHNCFQSFRVVIRVQYYSLIPILELPPYFKVPITGKSYKRPAWIFYAGF